MSALIGSWMRKTRCALSSTHPDSSRFESQRYWRGPVWLHINWMIADGLQSYGISDLATESTESSRRCIRDAGFREYFDCRSGAGCGGSDFSWTAAIALHWLGIT